VPRQDYLKLAGPAVGVMLVGFAEGLGAAKTYASRDGYQISPNRELIGLGTANLAAGLSSGMVVNGSLSKTAVNGSMGARTQASGLVIGVADSLLLLLFRMSRPHVAVLGEVPGSDGQWADLAVHPEDQTVPGVSVLRVESGVFFANTDHVRGAIEDAATEGIRAVVVDCETMPFVDVTAARMLGQLAADLGKRGYGWCSPGRSARSATW
jgi:MFS superfamily sulfate permease-like transporter